MKGRGHQVATVWDTTEVVNVLGPTAGDEEIKIAVADVECKQQTGLIRIWFDEETAIQKQLVAGDRAALDRARARTDKTLSKAAAVNGAVGR